MLVVHLDQAIDINGVVALVAQNLGDHGLQAFIPLNQRAVAIEGHSLTGIQAAVASGFGVSVLPASAVLPEHSVCTDLPELPPTELALISREVALTGLQRALVEFLREGLGQT
jgi:DNA-binding transcriptional LysR family regulator